MTVDQVTKTIRAMDTYKKSKRDDAEKIAEYALNACRQYEGEEKAYQVIKAAYSKLKEQL